MLGRFEDIDSDTQASARRRPYVQRGVPGLLIQRKHFAHGKFQGWLQPIRLVPCVLLNHFLYRKKWRLSSFTLPLILAAWDCSAWVRTYALFLEERLECFRVLKYDIETERLTKSPQCSTKVGIMSFLTNFVYLRCADWWKCCQPHKCRHIVEPGHCLALILWSICLHCSSCSSGLRAARFGASMFCY
jgi:hypothetical protein